MQFVKKQQLQNMVGTTTNHSDAMWLWEVSIIKARGLRTHKYNDPQM